MSIDSATSTSSLHGIQTGDRMNAREFRNRTQHLPEGTKVELIEGIVYMAAAVKLRHGQPHLFLGAWLTQYSFATPGTEYLLWRVDDEVIEWYALRDGSYELLPVREGMIHSQVVPGL